MPAIFISHSSLDPKEADDIKSSLARLGFERIFLDFDKATGIDAGENWEKRLYEELSRCHAVILVLTPNWMASKWCFAELTQARALGKVILPIICKPLGERFVLPDIQAVDLVDWSKGGPERLEQRLRAITNELARGFPLDPNRPPYPGINAFEREDAAIYFGRDDETRAVIERLDARRTQGGARMLVIIGASGAGKSSLLKAGVAPQLARRRGDWIVLPTIRPEQSPLEAFAKAIVQHLGKPDAWRDWLERLRSASAMDDIAELLKDVRVGEARGATALLPIDQFEELFTVSSPDERARFLSVLAGALDPLRRLPFMVLATARSDVLEGLIEVGNLAHVHETFPLAPMALDRVPRLVEGPAAVAGIAVEKGLADRIARDVESSEALPLLAQALALLQRSGSSEKRLTIAEYVALGDAERGLNPISNSVRLAADRALAGLRPASTETELAALRDSFVPHLVRVRLDDSMRVRQPARVADLPPAARRLIEALVAARLLTTRDGGIEVAHEALFKAWPRLDQWLTDENDFLTDLERIRAAHDVWSQATAEQKSGALLHGLQLSRARQWLTDHPRRFAGHDMEALRAFISASAQAKEAELRSEEQRLARERRNLRRARWALAAFFLAVTAALGGTLWQVYQTSKREAAVFASQAEIAYRARYCDRALRMGVAGLPPPRGGSILHFVSRELEDALSRHASARDCGFRIALKGHEDAVSSAAFSPDGSRVVTASPDKTARLWDGKTGALVATLAGHEGDVQSAAFSPDGSRVVTASLDKTARLWDGKTGEPLATLAGHEDRVWSAAFSPDGSRVVTASCGQDRAAVGRQDRQAARRPLAGHEGVVWSAAFSPDGSRVVTAVQDKTARLWDADTGEPLANRSRATRHVSERGVQPGRRARRHRLSCDKTARLWDAATGEPLGDRSRAHEGDVMSAAFSPDGRRVVTACEDKTARVWDADTGKPLATAHGASRVTCT